MNTSISQYLASRSRTACVVAHSGHRVCGVWDPAAPYPMPGTGAEFDAAFRRRYGVDRGKGNRPGEGFSDDVVERVARHSSNPFRLVNHDRYVLTWEDEMDLRNVDIGGVDAYQWLADNLARPLGFLAPRPGKLVVSGPRDVQVGKPATYSVPGSSGTRWLWIVTMPGNDRQTPKTTTAPRLTVTPLRSGQMLIDVVTARGGSDEGKAVVTVSSEAQPVEPELVEPPADPPADPPKPPEPPPVEPPVDPPKPKPPGDDAARRAAELELMLDPAVEAYGGNLRMAWKAAKKSGLTSAVLRALVILYRSQLG